MSEQVKAPVELTPEEQAAKTAKTIEGLMAKPFSIDSSMTLASDLNEVDTYVLKKGLAVLNSFFGNGFVMLHGASEEEYNAYLLKARMMQSVGKAELFEEEDADILLWGTKTKDGKDVEYTYSVMKGGFITSELTVEIQHISPVTDVMALVEEKVKVYQDLGDARNDTVRVSMAKPEFMANQKGITGIDVTRRNSSVQVSAEFARSAFKHILPHKTAFGVHMNLLTEMTDVRKALGMTDAEQRDGAAIGSRLIAQAIAGVNAINELRRKYEYKAVLKSGLKNLGKSKDFIQAGMNQDAATRFAYEEGFKLWNSEGMTSGKKKSLVKRSISQHEAFVMKLANEEHQRNMTNLHEKFVAEFAQTHGAENAHMKVAVATYISQYDNAKEQKNFSVLWDVLEFGLIAALMFHESGAEVPFVYTAPKKEQNTFFIHDSAVVRANALMELRTKKAGDEVRIIKQDGVMGLDFEAGFLPIKLSVSALELFPVVEDDAMFYTAKIFHYSPEQMGQTGISIKMIDFQLNGQAVASSILEEVHAEEKAMELMASSSFVAFDMNADMKELHAHYGEALLDQEFVFKIEEGGTNGYLVHEGALHLMMTSDEMADDLVLVSCDGQVALCK